MCVHTESVWIMTRGFSIVVTRAGGGQAARNNEQWRATARKHAILADCAHDSCSTVRCRSRPCTTSAMYVNCLCQDSRNMATGQCCGRTIGDTLPVVCNTVCKTVYCTVCHTVCFMQTSLTYIVRLLIHDYVCPALYRPDVRHQPGRC